MTVQITPLPPAPSRISDSPQVFANKADAHVASLDNFVTEANALALEANTNAQGAIAAKTAAQAAQGAAETAKAAAQAAQTGAGSSAAAAGNSATAAAGSATAASGSATAANTAKTAAQTAQTGAETAQGGANSAKTAAEAARDAATAAKNGAASAQTSAEAARDTALGARDTANGAATAAAGSASAAATAKNDAVTAKGQAETARDAAQAAQSGAQTARTGAEAARDAAEQAASTYTPVSQAEAEAGTSTTVRGWTAQRVWQAIAKWWSGILSAAGIESLGTAAGADLTTSTTDATAGRVTRVGDYGVGVHITINAVDYDTLTEPGLYVQSLHVDTQNSTNGPPKPNNTSALIEVFNAKNVLVQRITHVDVMRVFTRTRNYLDGWSGWLEENTSGNTLAIGTTASTARTALGLGSAATKNTTISRTETAFGNIVKVGDYGLGGTLIYADGASVVSGISNGLAAWAKGTAPIPPDAPYSGAFKVFQVGDGNFPTLLGFDAYEQGMKIATRISSGGALSPWRKIWTDKDLNNATDLGGTWPWSRISGIPPFGTGAGQFAQGNDSRIVGAVQSAGTGLTKAGTTLNVTYGTGAGTAAQGNDSRLSDPRPPTPHSHNASDINAGTLALARLPKLGLGITGETWHDVTGARTSGVTYTNTHGYPMQVMARTAINGAATIKVDSVQIALEQPDGANSMTTASCIVPAGSTYVISSAQVILELY